MRFPLSAIYAARDEIDEALGKQSKNLENRIEKKEKQQNENISVKENAFKKTKK